MAKTIEVLSFTALDDNKFEATGTCDGVAFLARTIMYRGEPIFKVQEAGEDGEVKHLNMKDSTFNRGARIAIARKLKAVRLERAEASTPAEDLNDLSVKELRARCKELGLSGYHKRGVRKNHLIGMLSGTVVVAEAA